jgi:hypothetical protein
MLCRLAEFRHRDLQFNINCVEGAFKLIDPRIVIEPK